jgi:hypothetical protein
MSNFYCGAPRAKPVAPYLKPQWDDIPACGRQTFRHAGVAFCCRGEAPRPGLSRHRRDGAGPGKRQIFHLQIWADSVNYNGF